MNILKAVGGVDFTKYALLLISQYVHWTKIGQVQNAVNLSDKGKFRQIRYKFAKLIKENTEKPASK